MERRVSGGCTSSQRRGLLANGSASGPHVASETYLTESPRGMGLRDRKSLQQQICNVLLLLPEILMYRDLSKLS